MDLSRIKLIVLDVDGVLTDGGLYVNKTGEELKRFHVQDGCALKAWRAGGGQLAVLSGRQSDALAARLRELGVEHTRSGVADKSSAYDELLGETGCDDAVTAYVGDDLADLEPMRRCFLPIAVANAVPAVKRAARMITRRGGGAGVAAEVIDFLLRKQRRRRPPGNQPG